MIDVQNWPDSRHLPIDKVGVKGLRYPITVQDKSQGTQSTIARINMYVNLAQEMKGTHMSRFLELLNERQGPFDIRIFGEFLGEIKRRLGADSAFVELAFPYFIAKSAPLSGARSLVDYDVSYLGQIDASDHKSITMTLRVPISTVCPCSKELAERGAHNQRGLVTLSVIIKRFVWIEDLIRLVESAASCEIFSLLKRADEKECTERAYDHPRFVEDLVREIAGQLKSDANVLYFKVEGETLESIHNHNAYALIEQDKGSRTPPHSPR